jgi:hypothetical protein
VYIPTANHPRFAALRIKSMGLVQGTGGVELPFFSVSVIVKPPVDDSATPPLDELNWGGTGTAVVGRSQIRVAITLAPAGGRPALFPPARTNPVPVAEMLPFDPTVAVRPLITQIWPAGCTPRTTLRFTVSGAG